MAMQERYNAAVAAYSAAMAQNRDTTTLARLARTVAAVMMPYTTEVWANRAEYLERQATYVAA